MGGGIGMVLGGLVIMFFRDGLFGDNVISGFVGNPLNLIVPAEAFLYDWSGAIGVILILGGILAYLFGKK